MIALRLSLTLLWRELRAGKLTILLLALALSVCGTTTVALIAERTQRALNVEANQLLGGDLVLKADRPIDPAIAARAAAAGLSVAQSAEFPSTVSADGQFQLVALSAVSANYPLRGAYKLRDDNGDRSVAAGPEAGTVWVGDKLLRRLGTQVGDSLQIGEATLRIAAELRQEPDTAINYFEVAPRVTLAQTDLAATGLVQPGSRIVYRQIYAGTPAAIAAFTAAIRPQLQAGQQLETARDGRPEIRSALDRAAQFLGLSLLMALVLAAVAIALMSARYAERHLSSFALLRVFGASSRLLTTLVSGQLVGLAVLGIAAGIALALVLEAVLVAWLSPYFAVALPSAGLRPSLSGALTGAVLLLGFALPPLLKLQRVPALKVLRHDLPVTSASALAVSLMAALSLGLLAYSLAGSWKLALTVLGGLGAGLAWLALTGWLLVRGLSRLRSGTHGALRLGLAAMSRRAGASVLQISALGLGLSALLVLLFAQRDLLAGWQASLPADAPNRFLINVQDAQLDDVRAQLASDQLSLRELFPMVRGRWVAHNGEAVRSENYDGARAQRLSEREFNLSYASTLKPDNEITAGRFWAADSTAAEASVEEGLADALDIALGDTLRFDLAGTEVEATVTSLRRVDWGSFTPNFFVVFSPATLQGRPASWIGAFHLDPAQAEAGDRLLQRFPNISLIELDRILDQVRDIADKLSRAVSFVFLFALVAGVLVLLAAIASGSTQRAAEAAILRTVGASARQLRLAHAAEFAAIGLTAGISALVIAIGLTAVVAEVVFDLRFVPSWSLVWAGLGGGVTLVLGFGLLATRWVRRTPPLAILRGVE